MTRCNECGTKLFPDSVPCERCEGDICGACCELLNGEDSKWERKVHDDTDCEEDIIGVYLDDSLICVSCSKEGEGERVTAEAVPNGFTCAECQVVVNV